MRSTLVSILGLVALALTAPTGLAERGTDVAATDRLLFSTTITGFLTAAKAKKPPTLDWTNDGCSSSPDNPLGFNLHNSCLRHDFGYRNYKAQFRFTNANKARIDSNFKADMYNQCKNEWFEDLCRGFADLYYEAVSKFGRKRAAEIMGRDAETRALLVSVVQRAGYE